MNGLLAADLAHYRALVVSTLPQFAGGTFSALGSGAERLVLECDGWIFRFGLTEAAQQRLRHEAAMLGFLKPRITMSLPQMQLHDGIEPFTQHLRLPGETLERAQYEVLDEGRRNALAMRVAQFYAELHALPLSRLQQVGAAGVEPWMSPEEILAEAQPKLPKKLHPFLKRTVKAYRKLTIAGAELVFGHFDIHGGNMAFDHQTGMLNGMFDFAAAGFGARHRDLATTSRTSADLTRRVLDRYEELARFKVDRELVVLYTSARRLADLASQSLPDGPALQRVIDWADEAGLR